MACVLPSIHDVMPVTMSRVAGIVDTLPDDCRNRLTLLVVPGLDWQPAQLDCLRTWQNSGIRLAGHGWQHECRRISTLYHRLHSVLLSRHAAEHLSEPADYLRDLLARCHAWFHAHDLAAPDFYVPPAWAQGDLQPQDLAAAPFRYFENTQGIIDSETGRSIRLPLIGYEADTRLRRYFLTVWNRLNCISASEQHPVRLGIHPTDFELLLGDDLAAFLRLPHQYLCYRQLFSHVQPSP